MIEALLLTASVGLSTGRGIFSKGIMSPQQSIGKSFFLYQGILFLFALIAVFLFNVANLGNISLTTVIYGLIYGVLLIGSQWLYTLALAKGTAATCSMVYAFGFILPTLCGFIFWNEEPTPLKIIGVLLVIPLVVLVSLAKGRQKAKSNWFLIPLLVAAICSGGLGIMQKIQQKSEFADQRTAFLLIGLAFACGLSFIVFLLFKKNKDIAEDKMEIRPFLLCLLSGVCFGLANMVNVILASLVPAVILFPIQNIGVIVLTTILGFFIFKERPKMNEIIAFVLGITSIIFLVI